VYNLNLGPSVVIVVVVAVETNYAMPLFVSHCAWCRYACACVCVCIYLRTHVHFLLHNVFFFFMTVILPVEFVPVPLRMHLILPRWWVFQRPEEYQWNPTILQ